VTGNTDAPGTDAPAKHAAGEEPGRTAAGPRFRRFRRVRRFRWRAIAIWSVCGLAALALWAAYARLSQTFPTNSDGAGNALQAWQMLHGNPLLRGWVLSDVSFYTTELPQYMLVELATGLNANVIHVAAGMTYALALVAAAALATGRARGWAAVIGGCIAAAIMLDPQSGDAIGVLLSSPDHIGTSVPMMLAWLILDRARPGWRSALAVSLVLGLAGVADSLVTYAAIAPLVLVVAIRLGHALLTDRSTSRRGILAGRRYEIGLAVGAVVATIAARVALRLIAALGGFSSPAPVASVASIHVILSHNLPVVGRGLLMLFGADLLDYPVGLVLVLHLVSVALVLVAVAVTAWHFLADLDLVAQLLLAGIVVNLAVFIVSSNVSWLPTMREVDVVLPFGAALAGRQLGPRLADALGRAPELAGRGSGPTGRGSGRSRAAAAGLVVALGLVGVGYAAGLVRQLTPRVPVSSQQRLADWLVARHLDNGLAGYWQAAVIAPMSDGSVQVRQIDVDYRLKPNKLVRGVREDWAGWYDPTAETADFVVLAPGADSYPGFTDRAAVIATFGRPAETYHFDRYTILVWPGANLLAELAPLPAG
jgi:hypothetical protein